MVTSQTNSKRPPFSDRTKLFIKIDPPLTDSESAAFQAELIQNLKAQPSTSRVEPPEFTRTCRGALLSFRSQAARWRATDDQTWLDSLNTSTRTCRISERRSALVLSHVPPIDVPEADWGVFGATGMSHPELHPRWFRFIEQLNPIHLRSGEAVTYRIRKVELLGSCAQRGSALAVWFHDCEVTDHFIGKGEFQFGDGERFRIRRVEAKKVHPCARCGKSGHATRNCRESELAISLNKKGKRREL